MTNLSGDVGELSFCVQIKRAATGKVEEYHLVGRISEEQLEQLTQNEDKNDERSN